MKSKALKKQQGTYRKSRDKNAVEEYIKDVSPAIKHIKIENVSKEVAEYFDKHIKILLQLGILQEIDLPQLKLLYKVLDDIISLEKRIEKETDANCYLKLLQIKARLITTYNELARLYFISPFARSKATLDSLAIQQMKSKADQSAVNSLLNKKRA